MWVLARNSEGIQKFEQHCVTNLFSFPSTYMNKFA